MADVEAPPPPDGGKGSDVNEIRRKALALLVQCGTTDSDDELPDYDGGESASRKDDNEPGNGEKQKMGHQEPTNPERGNGARAAVENRRLDLSLVITATDDEDEEDGELESYGDEEIDPLVKAVRELSYSLEIDRAERQQRSNVSRLTDGPSENICRCCNNCCCRRCNRRTQCCVSWVIGLVLFAGLYYLSLTQYPRFRKHHHGV